MEVKKLARASVQEGLFFVQEAPTTKRTGDIGATELARCASPINAIISLTRNVPADSTATNSTLDNEDVEILDDPFLTETSPTSPTTKIVQIQQLAAGDIDTEMADPTGTSSKSNDERVLTVLVSHLDNCIDPFTLVIVYGPSPTA
ncbi:hypothetical protein CLU79DRAFT_716653 [Phycomyces nitens]|nr:hypothetical protein CLU79DRAFT_716653 [Phycomyces nitens]